MVFVSEREKVNRAIARKTVGSTCTARILAMEAIRSVFAG